MNDIIEDANNNNNSVATKLPTQSNDEDELSPRVKQVLNEIYQRLNRDDLCPAVETQPISGVGENSYGLVLRVKQQSTANPTAQPHYSIVKISPKNEARRAHMHVVDYYTREVFMYERVLNAYHELAKAAAPKPARFDVAPAMYAASLEARDEFVIFEDLIEHGYRQNARAKMPTYDLVACALAAVAKLHGMSFVLQAKSPKRFAEYVEQMQDNLFTEDIEPVTVEFGKKSLSRTRLMLQDDAKKQADVIEMLQRAEDTFKAQSLRCVNGAAFAPYAVICHGDFWNNNILYKYESTASDVTAKAIDAKLIDFQMSRYAPPVLDVVHYLFACTEKELRDAHFNDFLAIYFDTLTQTIASYDLDPALIYPRDIYNQQLCDFGVYGLIMAAFAIPFFISAPSDIIDIDLVSKAIMDLSSSDNSDADDTDGDIEERKSSGRSSRLADTEKCIELIEEFDMLTPHTLPIFKRRMTNIVQDMIKYDMTKSLLLDL